MYTLSYFMHGKIECCRVNKRKNVWVIPVFFFTFLVLGVVFILLGYYFRAQMVMAEEVTTMEPASHSNAYDKEGVSHGSTIQQNENNKEELGLRPKAQQSESHKEELSHQPVAQQSEWNKKEISHQRMVQNAEEKITTDVQEEKIMYLTFDDGPSAEYTDSILDVLAKYDIKGTFFLVGENVEKYPEIARRIAKEGHTIGIHCYSHAYDDIYDSVESYVEDFEKAYQVIYEITGVEVKIFRFPGGSVNGYNKHVCKDIITEMTERGYVYFDWNASLEDAVKKTTPQELVQNAKDTAKNRDRVILLAHDTIYNTSLCIEEIILHFSEYKMEPLDEDVVPIRFRLN